MFTDYLDVTDELIQLLIQNNTQDEALGVVGSFLGRRPDYKQYFTAPLVMIASHLGERPGGLNEQDGGNIVRRGDTLAMV